MHNTRGRRHHAKVVKGLLAPFEKFIPLKVALKFAFGIVEQRKATAETVHLHAMINDQINRHQGVNLFRIAAQAVHSAAQSR